MRDATPWPRTRRAVLLLTLLSALVAHRPVMAEKSAELITMGPGDELWSRFGHVAIRITDPERGRDEIFNYGYAPFNRPDFLWDFVRGTARFLVVSRSWNSTVIKYTEQNRRVERQQLNLTPDQVERLDRFLRWNARPENREYRYDHLRDNCSTRVRDLLDEITGGALRDAVGAMEHGHPQSYRTYTLDAGRGSIHALIGMDLIGGPNQESPVGRWDLLYLPQYLAQAVATATLNVGGQTLPLARPAEVAIERIGPPPQTGNPLAGRMAALFTSLAVGLLLVIAGQATRRQRHGRLVAAIGRVTGLLLALLSLAFGLVGAVLAALIIVSPLPDFRWNENVLVFCVVDLALVGVGVRWLVRGRSGYGTLVKRYLDLRLVVLLALAVAKLAGIMAQDNWAFLFSAVGVLLGARLGIGPKNPPPADPLPHQQSCVLPEP